MQTSASVVYLDASALAKLVVREAESEALEQWLTHRGDRVSSELAIAELLRAVRPAGQDAVRRGEEVLARIYLLRLGYDVLREAARLEPIGLRTLDAIHLASALQASITEVATYDRRLATAAEAYGLWVAMPGAS